MNEWKEIRGKKRLNCFSEGEALIWDAQGTRLTYYMKKAELNNIELIKKCEKLKCYISIPNFSNYKNGKRVIAKEQLEPIATVLLSSLSDKGYSYDQILFKDYISGKEPLCSTYEEFVTVARYNPDINFEKYNSFFRHAGFILSGLPFTSISDAEGNTIDCGYDNPEYGLHYNGITKCFNPDDIELFYKRIIQYIQSSFEDYQDDSYDMNNKDEVKRYIKWHPGVFTEDQIKAIYARFDYIEKMKGGDNMI